MSRAAASKKASDKTKPPASQTPVITHEIVPGKFTDNDWNTMVDRDSSDEFVMDIMDEIMDATMTAIYDKYIQRQLLPFTITQARDAIIEIIEWQFLAKDEGETTIESDLGWAEDEEPEPAVTDCWAQGSVPRNLIQAPELEVIEETAEVEPEIAPTTESEAVAVVEEAQEPEELADVVSDTEEAPQATDLEKKSEKPEESPGLKKSASQKSKTKFRPYRGKLKSAGVSKMTESLEETEMKIMYEEFSASMPPSEDKPSTLLNMPASCTSILKVQTGRPPGNKDVVYDELGNVVAVMRLDPERLPTHKVNVKYHVVDPAVEAAQARLDAMRKGKSTGSKIRKSRPSKTMSTESLNTNPSKVKQQSVTPSVAPLPPPLIEEMDVSHGVVVKEGGRVKKGPGRYYRKLDILEENQKGMKPISLRVSSSNITVSDLLDRHTPILRPLGESSPLPPIVPHPPQHQQQVA